MALYSYTGHNNVQSSSDDGDRVYNVIVCL